MERYLANPGPVDEAVELVKNAKSVLFLGRGLSAPVASEGALKLMEIAYIPCLAYTAGELLFFQMINIVRRLLLQCTSAVHEVLKSS